jgi:RluA family pseudouridine synthase
MTQSPSILDWLVEHFPQAKKTTLREMIEKKRVILNGMPVKTLKQPVAATDMVEVRDAGAVPQRPTTLEEGLRIVHYDTDVIVIDKPYGLLTATHDEEPRPTVLKILDEYVGKQNHKNQALLVHRIDKDASGLLVFARNGQSLNDLKKQFFEHTITRRYDVVAHGVFKKPTVHLENYLIEDMKGRVHVTKDAKRGKEAVMDCEVVASGNQRAHLRCTLFTGRKHQIRVQLNAIGHTICGDPIYGNADEPPHRLALHASHLAFKHPGTGREAVFSSAPPASFASLIAEKRVAASQHNEKPSNVAPSQCDDVTKKRATHETR